jgi:hypothetical protein
MVLAVAAVTVVDRWWVLVPVMLLDFTVTFAVIATIVHLLRDDGNSPPRGGAPTSSPRHDPVRTSGARTQKS